jgi:hypothetical protein
MPDQTWLIVAVIFFYFAFVFWRFSNEPIRPFRLRPQGEEEEGETSDPKQEKYAAEFLHDFEGYLASINRMNKVRYRLSTGGFLIAAFTAIVAMVLG